MKNRRQIVLPSKPVLKRSESNIDKTLSENLPSKRKFTSVSLQQNLEFLHQQGIFFPKPVYPCGDADSYFKRTLRNYDFDLNLFRTPRTPSGRQEAKTAKSLDYLKKKKSAKSSFASKQRKRPKTPTFHLRPVVVKNRSSVPRLGDSEDLNKSSSELKNVPEEVDVDIFYSPGSRTLESSSHTLKNKSSESSLVTEEHITENPVVENTKQEAPENKEKSITKPKQPEEDKEFQEKKLANMAESGDEYIEEEEEEEQPAESEAATEEEEEEDTQADDLQQVEQMIAEASAELDEANEQNEQLLAEADEEEEAMEAGGGDGSIFTFDPAIDAAVLRELEEAEKQAKATAQIIYELKTRVTELLKKEKHTEEEARELEQKNKELKQQMILFEEKTKRIQFLIAQTNLFDKMIPPKTPLQVSHKEDMLPKVIVCGMTENNIPKLILCDDKKRKTSLTKSKDANVPASVVPKIAKRLSDSYTMQEKLAAENADLEGMRYQLQSDVLNKDQTIEYLQRQLCTIQGEMRMLYKENSVLNEKINQMCTPHRPEVKHRKGPCGKGRGTCPADIEHRLNEYSETTKILEKQLNVMENDVKTMQTELTAVQAEREHLEQHKKVIICPPICVPHPCQPCTPCSPPPCTPCITYPSAEQKLREVEEKYARLQDDFKGKVTEVAGLRADNEKLKDSARDAEEVKKALEEKVKDLERNLRVKAGNPNKVVVGSKEQMLEQEQQLSVAKQRFREAQDELEELRAFIQDLQSQLDDYRNKYLEAQQEAEEFKRQVDLLELDANRVNEQVNLEIQRVKGQFQEKLQELLPLPEMLKNTQIQLQEAQQMHLLAERNNEALNRDLQIYKDKIAEITKEMEDARSVQAMGESANMSLEEKLAAQQRQLDELQEENDSLKTKLEKNEELLNETERELQAKMHEIAQLSAQLESVREESARQVARNKERCETVRRSMQNQISDLERQLAQSRAQARSAQKDRDDIRQKMQAQINNLHENFEDAQMRIRNLQGHVNYLKQSYTTNGNGALSQGDSKTAVQDACNCGI